MNNWDQWESQLHSWKLRRPSAGLKARLFPPAIPVQAPARSLAGGWRWLAPAMGLFLFVAVLSGPRVDSVGYVAGGETNNLLLTLGSNHGYAYVAAGFHSRQNMLEENLEWTSRRQFISAPGSSENLKTNSLMR